MLKVKNEINKLIFSKIIDILFVCFFLLIILPMQEELQFAESKAFEPSKTDLNYTYLSVEKQSLNNMYPMSNQLAMATLDPIEVRVINDSLTLENYTLTLVYSKNSTLNANLFNIAINDNILSLKNVKQKEDEENIYFILDKNNITGECKEYKIKIWLDESVDNEAQGKNMSMSFKLFKTNNEN